MTIEEKNDFFPLQNWPNFNSKLDVSQKEDAGVKGVVKNTKFQ